MRLLIVLYFLLPIAVAAQPDPPWFCFVLADDVKARRPLQRSITVVQYYLDPVPFRRIDDFLSRAEVLRAADTSNRATE